MTPTGFAERRATMALLPVYFKSQEVTKGGKESEAGRWQYNIIAIDADLKCTVELIAKIFIIANSTCGSIKNQRL
jgi:hypothetical protein